MTTLDQAAELLALAAAYDSRKPDRARLMAWHDVLADLDAADCAQAIRDHYRDSRDFLMPSDVRHGALRIAAQRARAAAAAKPHWTELQPEQPVPMPGYVKRAWADFLRKRELPPDVEAAS